MVEVLVASVLCWRSSHLCGFHHGGEHLPEVQTPAGTLGWAVGWDRDLRQCHGAAQSRLSPVPVLLPSRWCHWTANATVLCCSSPSRLPRHFPALVFWMIVPGKHRDIPVSPFANKMRVSQGGDTALGRKSHHGLVTDVPWWPRRDEGGGREEGRPGRWRCWCQPGLGRIWPPAHRDPSAGGAHPRDG